MKIRYVPPYKSLVEITSSPGFNNFITASDAAKPDPKLKACLPYSIAAIAFCKAVRVGFCVRAYSYPLCFPGASCT